MGYSDYQFNSVKLSDEDKKNINVAIIVAKFNQQFTQLLIDGAHKFFISLGLLDSQIKAFWVPGAFEIPALAARLCESGKFDGILGLGVVIRGDTSHYDYVCGESARGLMDVSLKYPVAISNGILTCENQDQVNARIGGVEGHKGIDCAKALIELIQLRKKI